MTSDAELVGEGKSWKRFAIIPNIEGQMYTFGNNYISREAQGEFIFWDGRPPGQKRKLGRNRKNSMCQITVAQNQFWITALEGNSVYVNDVPISCRTQLNFGHFVIFGDHKKVQVHTKAEEWSLWSDEPYPTRFLFKQREFVIVEPESLNPSQKVVRKNAGNKGLVPAVLPAKRGRRSYKDEDTASAIGLNPVVLSKILSYFPISILKSVRFVSKSWNEEVGRLLKRRCAAHLLFDGNWGVDQAEKSMKLFRYSTDMGNNLHQNWKMSLPVPPQVVSTTINQEAKFVSDFDWLFKKSSPCIRSLELGSKTISGFRQNLLIMVLERLQSTLEDLILFGDWNGNNKLFPSDNFIFKKLRRFTISMEPSPSDPHFPVTNNKPFFLVWLKSLIPSLIGVSSLRLNFSDDDATFVFLSDLDKYFPKLNELGKKRTGIRTASQLLKSKKLLKKLELNKLEIREGHVMEDVTIVEKLINTQAESLESFQFFIPHMCHRVQITLPLMTNLNTLNIGLLGYINVNPTCATLAFPGPNHQINYEHQFPCLQSLTIWPWGDGNRTVGDISRFWTENAEFFNLFFPLRIEEGAPQQVCKTLKYLDIPWEDRRHRVFPRAEELTTMFPNVFNNWANDARIPPRRNMARRRLKDKRILPNLETSKSVHTHTMKL